MRKLADFALFRDKSPEQVQLILEELERIKRVSQCQTYQFKKAERFDK